MVSESKNSQIGDEQILAERVVAQHSQKHSILNDISIDGEVFEFSSHEISFPSLPEYEFSMILPKDAKPLALEYAKIKYPSENRPEIILSNDSTTLNITFSYAFDVIGDYKTRLTQYKAFFKRLNPSYVFLSEGIISLNSNISVAYFDLCGAILDGDIYNMYFFSDFPITPQIELFSVLSCPYHLYGEWNPLFLQMIETIKPKLTNGLTHN